MRMLLHRKVVNGVANMPDPTAVVTDTFADAVYLEQKVSVASASVIT